MNTKCFLLCLLFSILLQPVLASPTPVTWPADQPLAEGNAAASVQQPFMGRFERSRIDQAQNSATALMATFSQTDLAQSFQTQQGLARTIGAGIRLHQNTGSSDNVTIELWSGLPNAGGVLLRSGSGVGVAGQWFDVQWPGILLEPNSTYYLVFSGNTTLGISGDTGNPYPHGQVFANPGFVPFPVFDYAFRTWTVALEDASIDQQQNNASSYIAAFNQTGLAQSFQTQQNSWTTVGAGIKLQPGVGSSDNVTIELWSGLPNAGGVLLRTGSGVGIAGQWFDVQWPEILLEPNSTHYLVFSGNTTLGISGDTENPYPHGQVFANAGYQPFPNFDYTFRTWVLKSDDLFADRFQAQ